MIEEGGVQQTRKLEPLQKSDNRLNDLLAKKPDLGHISIIGQVITSHTSFSLGPQSLRKW